MDSKNAILILGLLAIVFLISSEVSARDLAETSTNTQEVNDVKYGGGYSHGHGGHYGGGGHHGGHGLSNNEVDEKSNEVNKAKSVGVPDGGGDEVIKKSNGINEAKSIGVPDGGGDGEVNDAKYGHYGGGHHGGHGGASDNGN